MRRLKYCIKAIGMKILAFFYCLPGILSGLGLYAVAAWFAGKSPFKRREVITNYLIGLGLVLTVLLVQTTFPNNEATIIGMVSDIDLREILTRGVYGMENGVDTFAFVRFLILVTLFVFLWEALAKDENLDKFLRASSLIIVSSFIFVFLAVSVLGGDEFKKIISPISSLNSPNYLTQDSFGYRISGFFHEPSQASVFAGTALACSFLIVKGLTQKLFAVASVFVVFFLSRSFTVIPVFLIAAVLLRSSRAFSLMVMVFLFFAQVVLRFLADRYWETGLFRSLYERSFKSEVFEARAIDVLFGYDFGEIYSFEPLFGAALQVGYVGLLAIFFFLRRDVSTFVFALFCFAVVPQLWYSSAWLAIGMFSLTKMRLDETLGNRRPYRFFLTKKIRTFLFRPARNA